MTIFAFAPSAYAPLTIGFFGLGTGYFIWGGMTLFGQGAAHEEGIDKTIGLWGIWMPGFMQFITGVYLLIGLTWFQVFGKQAPLYMAALAFTAYGVHWFVLGYRRYIGTSETPNGFMAIPFTAVSILGVIVFFRAGDTPVGILFILLTLIYLSEIVASFRIVPNGARLVAIWQFINGIWLTYLTYAAVLKFVFGDKIWL